MRRIKKRYLVILLIVLAAGILTKISYDERNTITGEEWLQVQDIYLSDLSAYADNMDTIFALYIGGSITEDDFLNHIQVMSDELALMEADRQETVNKYTVRTGSHTYSSKKGCEAIDECYVVLEDILEMAAQNSGDINALSYKYLAYHQTVIDNLAEYMAAVELTEAGEEDTGE